MKLNLSRSLFYCFALLSIGLVANVGCNSGTDKKPADSSSSSASTASTDKGTADTKTAVGENEKSTGATGTSSTESAKATPAPAEPATTSADGGNKKLKIAYVTNGIASFWDIAEAGAVQAGSDLGVEVLVRMPTTEGGRVANQKRMIEELLTGGVDGVAVSPIDPKNQGDVLNAIGEKTKFVTHDSDAPESNRLLYIGMANYDAGRMCGKLVKKALPEGGEIIILVGSIDQLNARQRRQGLIDELLDRSSDPDRYDEPGKPIKGDKYTVLDTRTDNFDFNLAKSLAQDSITAYPEVDAMVGLFAYNPPYILEAIESAGKTGQIKLIGFDEADETLQAIIDGKCEGTIVQNPYMYGYESVRILKELASGNDKVIPEGGFMNIEAREINKENVQEFWDDLKAKLEKSSKRSQQK